MCDCYHTRTRARAILGGAFWVDERYGVCYGTKECDECSCGGDPAKCDFYPEKRKRVKESCKNDHNNLCQKEDVTTTSCVENNNKCTFDKKEVTPIKTAEMWLAAQADGKTYRVSGPRQYTDMRYNKEDGFYNCCRTTIQFENIEVLMRCTWTLYETMTRVEAEKALGVEIID